MSTRRELANVIRVLAMEAVQQANSGHPGAPMGMADFAEVLWHEFLKHNPANPAWWDRDRQLGSRCAGHPEHELATGIETTTGPLGQGLANGVGMALAEKMLAAQFNRPGLPIVDHHTWVTVGDGCLMEGISHEAYGWHVQRVDGHDAEAVAQAIRNAQAEVAATWHCEQAGRAAEARWCSRARRCRGSCAPPRPCRPSGAAAMCSQTGGYA